MSAQMKAKRHFPVFLILSLFLIPACAPDESAWPKADERTLPEAYERAVKLLEPSEALSAAEAYERALEALAVTEEIYEREMKILARAAKVYEREAQAYERAGAAFERAAGTGETIESINAWMDAGRHYRGAAYLHSHASDLLAEAVDMYEEAAEAYYDSLYTVHVYGRTPTEQEAYEEARRDSLVERGIIPRPRYRMEDIFPEG